MLCNHHLMVVQNAVEGPIDAVIQIVHYGVQFASFVPDLPLGVDLANQGAGCRHKEASWFGDYVNAFVGKMTLHRGIHTFGYL